MKPTSVVIDYHINEITKRVTKAFAKKEIDKLTLDKAVDGLETIRQVVETIKKHEDEMNRRKKGNEVETSKDSPES